MLHKDSKSKKKKGSSGEGSIINQVIILTLNFEFFIYFKFYVFFFFFQNYFIFYSVSTSIVFHFLIQSFTFIYILFFCGEGGGAGRTKDKFLVFISQLLLLYMKFSCSSTNQKVFIIFNRNKYGVVSGVRKNGG